MPTREIRLFLLGHLPAGRQRARLLPELRPRTSNTFWHDTGGRNHGRDIRPLAPVIEMSDQHFFAFSARNRDLRMECTRQGDLIIMTRRVRIWLDGWSQPWRWAACFGPSTGWVEWPPAPGRR